MKIGTNSNTWPEAQRQRNREWIEERENEFRHEMARIHLGGGEKAIKRQYAKNRLTARERIQKLIDENSEFLELGIYAAYQMYEEYGSPAAAGVITGIGLIEGRDCMIIANDATVKAGAYFEITLKKTLRAQQIALENNIPVIYLVDSAGVFLPLQDQVFPDEAHFGRIFFNNARLSALGVPQIAAVMGPCVAGGAYLPVMCDKFILTEGGSMFLAGPALVKAAIGQEIDEETLGGAYTHNAISGTADYIAKSDNDALREIRATVSRFGNVLEAPFNKIPEKSPQFDGSDLNRILVPNGESYDVRELLARILDDSEFDEYKAEYGKTVLTGYGRIGGMAVGIVANQKLIVKSASGEMQMGGVIYNESADKAARFIMNCNQEKIPLLFIHDVNGFIVGKQAEWSGIAKDGAKMVQAVSNSVVPKISLVIGGSYGAGNYAMSGRAYDPRFIFAWPSAKIAVMGGDQAAKTLAEIKLRRINNPDEATREKIIAETKANYERQSDIRYGAARMWVDEVIFPQDTRRILKRALEIVRKQAKLPAPNFGVLQV